jgi:hypothetical protein
VELLKRLLLEEKELRRRQIVAAVAHRLPRRRC